MKAFVRRNGAAMAKARAEYDDELAAAWERAAVATAATAAVEEAVPAASAFDLAYYAYLRYSEDKADSDMAVFFVTTRALHSRSSVLRWTGRIVEAWESKNHRRICGRRFADRFAADGDGAAAVALELGGVPGRRSAGPEDGECLVWL